MSIALLLNVLGFGVMFAQTDALSSPERHSVRHIVSDVANRATALRAEHPADDERMDILLRRVGRLQLRTHMHEEALRTTSLIDDEGNRTMLAESIAYYAARRGDIEACKTLVAATPDNRTNVNNWRFGVSSAVVEELCAQRLFADALSIAKLQATASAQQSFFAIIAVLAANSGAHSVVENVLPQLDPHDQCDALRVAAMQSWRAFHSEERARGYLDRAGLIAVKIESAPQRWSHLSLLCACYDTIGARESADNLMAQISDADSRAGCALLRAEGCARRRRFDELHRYLQIAHDSSPTVGISLGVLRATVEAGDAETALRLAAKYSSREKLRGTIDEGILQPAFERKDYETALIAIPLLPDPYGRAGALLYCAELARQDENRGRRAVARARSILAQVEVLAAQIEAPSDRLEISAKLAKEWHEIGDEEHSKELLSPLVALLEGGHALAEQDPQSWQLLYPLVDALAAVKMETELEAVLKHWDTANVLKWRVGRLCDQGQFAEALVLIEKSESRHSAWLQTDVLRSAAEAQAFEWALDQARLLKGDAETKLERLVEVLDVMTDRPQCDELPNGVSLVPLMN
jgi:hypothetical protein